MIDHVSIGVKDLESSSTYYESVLATIGYRKLLEKPGTVGFGKKYPNFWLNHRPALEKQADNGTHVCLRCDSVEAVSAFHKAALSCGGTGDGAPGYRKEYSHNYFACFVKDRDGNKIEVVTFVKD